MISSIEAISENGSVSKSWPLTSGPKTKEVKIIGGTLSRRQDGARNKTYWVGRDQTMVGSEFT